MCQILLLFAQQTFTGRRSAAWNEPTGSYDSQTFARCTVSHHLCHRVIAITPASMYRDRLAASRAQRSQPIELTTVAQSSTSPTTSPNEELSDLSTFLAEDTSIQQGILQLKENVTQISALHTQSINAIGEVTRTETDAIDSLTARTRTLIQDLKQRIKRLESAPQQQDAQLRKNRISLLRSKFLEAIQDYQREEQENRAKSRQRVERQLKIVNPDATPEDVTAALEGESQQIFANALTTSTRYAESRVAYREVQERQQDLRKMEQTLSELARLFGDMGVFIDQQDQMISAVEDSARVVHEDTERAADDTAVAIKHARSYRKGRWICFFICLFVVCVLALVLGLVFGTRK